MSDMADFGDLFGGMGGDLFSDFGKAPEKKAAKKPAEKASKKNDGKKGGSTKKALETKFTFPVTVRCRNFAIRLTGEGEVSLQALVEKLVESANLPELKHARVKFAKMGESEMRVLYSDLVPSEDDASVTLPVTVADGQLAAVYENNSQLEVAEDDEPTVKDLVRTGLSDEARQGLMLDYDESSGIAIPVYQDMTDKEAGMSIKPGDQILANGEARIVENASTVIPDHLGAIPDGWGAEYKKLKDGFYYLGLKPEAATRAMLISIDRSAFGIKDDAKPTIKKEMIGLPVEVLTQCPRVSVTLEAKDFDGKDKVSFDEIDEKLHAAFPVIGERKPSDHIYQPDAGLLEISYTSGRKGFA